MEPEYSPGETIFAFRLFLNLQRGNVVILKDPRTQRLLMKRISNAKNGCYYVLGDNERVSTDSRTFGWVEKKNIIAKVIMKL